MNREDLKQYLNPLYGDQQDVNNVLNQALQAIDKGTSTKKINPELVMPGYKKFYTNLAKAAVINSSKPSETLSKQKVIVFLQHYKGEDGNPTLKSRWSI